MPTRSSAFIDLSEVLLYDVDATWFGERAAREGVAEVARALVPPQYLEQYDAGVALPNGARAFARGLGPNEQRRLTRMLRAMAQPRQEKEAQALPVGIDQLVQRADVGTDTRYDLTLSGGINGTSRTVTLRDLRASDVLHFDRLRPIALDAGLVLPSLGKGLGGKWCEEVQRAMDAAVVKPLAAEYSEAGEIKEILQDLTESARLWEWSEDEPHPVGIRRIPWKDGALIGFPRGPLRDEVRRRLGKVSRVALARAVASLGWAEHDWRDSNVYLRVWAIDPELA